jgi:hypothetical protein
VHPVKKQKHKKAEKIGIFIKKRKDLMKKARINAFLKGKSRHKWMQFVKTKPN